MLPRAPDDRLSQISTLWTMLVQAHGGSPDGTVPAQHALLDRYGGAVHRYLLGAVRDPDAAGELMQEFAVRFLRGDFRRADPVRGRFRDYLKTALIHLVTDFRRARQQWPKSLSVDTPADYEPDVPDDDAVFWASWRAELLDRTWDALAKISPTGHAVLMLHVAEPDLTSSQVADRASDHLGRRMTAAAARKALQRAHEQYAELLVDEVARSMDDPTAGDLETELTALDLRRYCESALAKRR